MVVGCKCSMIGTETQARLQRRAREEGESTEEIIVRLLDETAPKVELKQVVETAIEQYDHVPQVAVEHPSLEEPRDLVILVRGANCVEEGLDALPVDAQVVIDTKHGAIQLPVEMRGLGYLPPSRDSRMRTTVYQEADDEVRVDIETGVEYLEEKLRNPEAWKEEWSGNSFEPFEVKQ